MKTSTIPRLGALPSVVLGAMALAASPAGAQPTTQTPVQAQPAPASPEASYPRKATGVGAVIGGYAEARWAENWSAYRDPAKRTDALDALKYIPLSDDGSVWLSLSGEMRARTAWFSSPGLRDTPDQRLDTLRLVGGADLHIGSHLRFYGELTHAGAGGDNIGNPVGAIRNDLAATQAFLDVTGQVGGHEVGARYGRQFFTDGSPYLVSTKNGATVLSPFQGTRAWVRGRHWRADVFDLKPVVFGTSGLEDDRADDARRFSGVTASLAVPKSWFGGSELYFDPFVWRYKSDTRRWGATTAHESREYHGARLWGQAGAVGLDWALARQTGRYGPRDIDAWHLFTQQNVALGEGQGAPRLGLRFDYGSGGGAYDAGPMKNAVTPQGVPIFYSYQNVFNPVNMIALAPSVVVRRGAIAFTAEVQGTWRASRRDAVYRATDLPYAGTQNGDGRRVGEVYRLQVAHTLSSRASLLGRYEHLAAGPALTDAGYGDADYLTAWINFRF